MTSVQVLLLVLLVLVFLVVAFFLVRLRRTAWLEFARAHGLRHGVDDGDLRVSGTVDGRQVRLDLEPAGSDTGLGAVVLERLRVWLGSGLPDGLVVRPLPDPLLETGKESLEDRAELSVANPSELRAWLTDDRRKALLGLLRHASPDRAGVEDGAAWISRRTAFRDANAIEEDLQVLLRIAGELD